MVSVHFYVYVIWIWSLVWEPIRNMSSFAALQGLLVHSLLSSLSHCRVILDQTELVCASWASRLKKPMWNDLLNLPPWISHLTSEEKAKSYHHHYHHHHQHYICMEREGWIHATLHTWEQCTHVCLCVTVTVRGRESWKVTQWVS